MTEKVKISHFGCQLEVELPLTYFPTSHTCAKTSEYRSSIFKTIWSSDADATKQGEKENTCVNKLSQSGVEIWINVRIRLIYLLFR